MILDLVEHDIEINFVSIPFIKELMMKGFKGYENMTNEEITKLWEKIQ